jgi:hypothetical protein
MHRSIKYLLLPKASLSSLEVRRQTKIQTWCGVEVDGQFYVMTRTAALQGLCAVSLPEFWQYR